MSLSVHDPRSRGKSPGGRSRDRSRSRDTRAPSPPHRSTRESSKKSSKKYYESESDSDTRRSKSSSKKYKDQSDSDHDRHKKSSRRHKDESDSDTYKKQSKKGYSDDDSDRRSKKSSRKNKDRGRDRSASSSSSSSSSEDDHRSTRYKEQKSKTKRGPSPDSQPKTKRAEYVQSAKPQYDRERVVDGRHPSYAGPNPYEHAARPQDYSRQIGTSVAEAPYAVPGQYNWDYDQPNQPPQNTSRHPSIAQERQRQLSLSGEVNASAGYAQHPHYPPQQIPPQYGYPQPQPQPQQQRPEAHRIHSNSSTGSGHYQYAEPAQDFNYIPKTDARKPSYSMSSRPQFVEAKPHGSVLHAEPPSGLGSKMHRLSVSGGAGGMLALTAPGQHHSQDMHGGLPPGSPLLEAYHGTYQSISPMPSPMMLPSTMDEGLSDLERLSPGYSSNDSRQKSSHHGRKVSTGKRVSFYDPEPDALALAAALKHSTPDAGPINKILPQLSEDHILELRTEYKKHIKVGGKGINIAKHIKLKVPGNLGKAAYAVALGRWESEAHWANFWYQSNSSRRELLIESLMGRTNSEIVKIKDAFSDKRYNDSLEKCMQTELKKDKFRNAVLLALEEKRMSNNEKLDVNLIRRDTQELHRALTSKEGGETAMINIIV
ncbi:MAG: hypothetical protein Q9168_001682, partial [Polycauliona sp. 1 TL-2023]